MKVNVEFDLNVEEEKEIFEELSKKNGTKLKIAMWDFAQEVLRKHRKYGTSTAELGEILEMRKENEEAPSSEQVVSETIAWVERQFYEYLERTEAEID